MSKPTFSGYSDRVAKAANALSRRVEIRNILRHLLTNGSGCASRGSVVSHSIRGKD
jgi:hypothetical protein